MNIDCSLPEKTNSAIELTPQGFFKFKTPVVPPSRQVPSTSNTLSALSTPLPLPELSQLTRSQLIFSAGTTINPRSLTIERGIEFFLFMDMRATHQWSSFTMNSRKWVGATKMYNEVLAKDRKSKGLSEVIKKNPRALMDKLGEIEPMIMKRLATNDFKCKLPRLILL